MLNYRLTARGLNNLARVLRDQGLPGRGPTLYDCALTMCEARLGADHPDTVASRENLAAVLTALDDQQ
jgi:hypothetical protein